MPPVKAYLLRKHWSGGTCYRRLRRKIGKWMWMLAYGSSNTTAPQMGIGRDSGSDA